MSDRDQLVDLLETSATSFTASFRRVSAGQFVFRPAPDKWSIAEVAEHVTLAEVGSGKLIRGRMTREPAAPELLAQAKGAEGKIDKYLRVRDRVIPAPDIVLPKGTWSTPAQVIAAFETSRLATIEWLKSTSVDLMSFGAPHPALGPLNCYQWGYFLGVHCLRHVEQIEEVKRAAGFPAA